MSIPNILTNIVFSSTVQLALLSRNLNVVFETTGSSPHFQVIIKSVDLLNTSLHSMLLPSQSHCPLSPARPRQPPACLPCPLCTPVHSQQVTAVAFLRYPSDRVIHISKALSGGPLPLGLALTWASQSCNIRPCPRLQPLPAPLSLELHTFLWLSTFAHAAPPLMFFLFLHLTNSTQPQSPVQDLFTCF